MGRNRKLVYDEAYKMYEAGLSVSQVAIKIKVSRQRVFRAFKDRGFQLRGPNFQLPVKTNK